MFTDDIIRRALEEDIGDRDVTTDAIVPENLQGIGRIVTKQELVVAGLGVAGGVFALLDPTLHLRQTATDGDRVAAKTTVMEVSGSCRSLLKGERLALNFLQRLCGIATLTRQYVDRTKGSKAKILDTRKTVPLFRHLDKYAVRMGGGENHRFGLYDGILIKNNHLEVCHGDVREAIRRVRMQHAGWPIVIELQRLEQVIPAVEAKAERLLLDNMDDDEIRQCIERVAGRAQIEVSGGITLDRVEPLARMGVDYLSVGALTHSPRAADLHFRIAIA